MGKVITIKDKGNFIVTGVLVETGKSHIDFNAYASSSSIPTWSRQNNYPTSPTTGRLPPGLYLCADERRLRLYNLKGQVNSIAADINKPTKPGYYPSTCSL